MKRLLLSVVTLQVAFSAPGAGGLASFHGFEGERYAEYDKLIVKLAAEFNRHRGAWADANRKQAKTIPDIDPLMIRAHMIEESGGNDQRSLAAWRVDPLQVNVPGDWNKYKAFLGLKEPKRRNEGTAENNIRAGIKFLVRKGFGRSGQPVRNSSELDFGGWRNALECYNGRSDMVENGAMYREVYADNILRRADNRDETIPIGVKLASPAPEKNAAPAKKESADKQLTTVKKPKPKTKAKTKGKKQ